MGGKQYFNHYDLFFTACFNPKNKVMRTRFFTTAIAFVGSVLFIRLIFLQILSDQYEDLSLKNSVLKRYVYPERGYVFDRNGTLLVSNQPMYDLMVIPKNLKAFEADHL